MHDTPTTLNQKMSSSKFTKIKLKIEKSSSVSTMQSRFPQKSRNASIEKHKSSNQQPSISKFFGTNIDVGAKKRKFDNADDEQPSTSKKQQILQVEKKVEASELNCSLSHNTISKLKQFERSDEFTFPNSEYVESPHNSIPTISQENNVKDRKKDKSIESKSSATSYITSSTISHGDSDNTHSNYSKYANIHKDISKSLKSQEATSTKQNNGKSCSAPAKQKYTPLEQQFIEVKEANPNILLFVECGYKYRFFGEDAEIAAKELNIFCHPDHNFMTASIPTHRLHVHISRLVSKGYKVGVVKQTETAALKAAGENKSAPFTRKLTNVYTKATYIDGSIEVEDRECMNVGGHLLCLHETLFSSTNQLQTLAFISVDLATGEVIYDVFPDNKSRFELETRLTHIEPIEVIMAKDISNHSEETVKKFASMGDGSLRIEKLSDRPIQEKEVINYIKQMYEKMGASVEPTREVLKFPIPVLCCLCTLLSYLEEFTLSKILKLNNKFSLYDKHMQLCGRTLRNLEVFENSLDQKKEGSLYWLLNQTHTNFGARMLKKWLSYPLLNIRDINERLDAIQCILDDPSLGKVEVLLKSLPDLERGLTLIFYSKCSAQEFLSVSEALLKVEKTFKLYQCQNRSSLLRHIFSDIPLQLSSVENWVKSLNPSAAKNGNISELFMNEENFPSICSEKESISNILAELQEHKREIRIKLKLPALEYTTILGTEFLIEAKNTLLKLVPHEWVKINGTKTVSRFHTPFIIDAFKSLSQHREKLTAACKEAWQEFLRSFEDDYSRYKKAVQHLACLDCLFSLAHVAKQYGYCRPNLIEEPGVLEITQGCHPIVNLLLTQQSQQYVPNDTNLKVSENRCMMVTGPNMGGKSSYIKQVALITLMAQIGSFVPAETAKLSIMDAVHTRMGASDNICKGQSTFMVELQEASEVISKATDRSLVILDELGRGTSTHDGVAIAHATLKYFVEEVKCLTLFVTHYPTLVEEIEQCYPDVAINYHMSFYVEDENDAVESLAFLYQLVPGMAERSYGLNVARLADIPCEILKSASAKSQELEQKVMTKMKRELLFQKLMETKLQRRELSELLQDKL